MGDISFIAELEAFILAAAQTIYDAAGWLGVAGLMVFENATGITPSEVILGLAGWMLIEARDLSPTMIFLGGFYAALGSVVGASLAYWTARLGGRPVVERFASWVRIDARHITRVELQFQRWGPGLVLVGRMIPGIRTLISIPAGLTRMPFIQFVVTTFVGAYIWCTILIGAGYLLGHEWVKVSAYLKLSLPYLLAAGVLALGVYLWILRRKPVPAYVPVERDDG
jgi:membrane protein DedA with SNARE-associated domain